MSSQNNSNKGVSNVQSSSAAMEAKEASMNDNQWLKSQGFTNSKGQGSTWHFAQAHGEKPYESGLHNAKVIMGSMRENHPASKAGEWYREEKAQGREPTLKD